MYMSIFAAFLLYFLILIGIAFIVYHRTKKAADFMLGDRSMNYFMTAIAAQASDMSSWLFLAFPAAVFANGLFEFWTAIGLIIFMYLNWTFIAPKLRVATQEYNSITLTSYFSARFNDTAGYISATSGLLSLFFFTIYIASGLVGIGRLFQGAFALNLSASMLLGLIIALIYTLIGGFLAVAWCNVFKGLFMLAVIMIVPYYALPAVGGIAGVLASATAAHVPLTLFPAGKSVLASLLLVCGWGLGYFGQPHILIYFMSIDNVKKIVYSKYIGIAWMALALTSAAAIGLVGVAYFGPDVLVPESLFINLTKELFSPFFAGIALCGIFAATLATMNNHILIAGSVFAEDLYKKFINPHLSNERQIWFSRLGSILISAIALLVVWFGNTDSIYTLVAYAWSGLGSSFGPVLLASLYSTSVTRSAVLCGMSAGGLTAGLWPLIDTTVMPLVPGFIVNCVILILVSLFTNKK